MLDYRATTLCLEQSCLWKSYAAKATDPAEKDYCYAMAEYYWTAFVTTHVPENEPEAPEHLRRSRVL